MFIMWVWFVLVYFVINFSEDRVIGRVKDGLFFLVFFVI